jgi:hypothetical protein
MLLYWCGKFTESWKFVMTNTICFNLCDIITEDVITDKDIQLVFNKNIENGNLKPDAKIENTFIKVYDKSKGIIESGTDTMYEFIDQTPLKQSEKPTFLFIIPAIGWTWWVDKKFFNTSLGSWCFYGTVFGFQEEWGSFSLDDLFKLCMKKNLDMYISYTG